MCGKEYFLATFTFNSQTKYPQVCLTGFVTLMPDKVQFVENFVEVYAFNRAVSTQHDEFLIG